MDGLIITNFTQKLLGELHRRKRRADIRGKVREQRGDDGGGGSFEVSLERFDEIRLFEAKLSGNARLDQDVLQLPHGKLAQVGHGGVGGQRRR